MRAKRDAVSPPMSAIREFGKAAAKEWNGGISLDELLARVNRVVAKFLPAEEGGDSRVSPTFLPRTFRHYVTLGCIDAGHREGRSVVYYYRHFLQALLVRRLLSERVSARRMPEMMAGRSTDELERMLLGGVEIVARVGGTEEERVGTASPAAAESWRRVRVVPGIELHLRGDLPKPRPAELKQIIALLETTLRKNL